MKLKRNESQIEDSFQI